MINHFQLGRTSPLPSPFSSSLSPSHPSYSQVFPPIHSFPPLPSFFFLFPPVPSFSLPIIPILSSLLLSGFPSNSLLFPATPRRFFYSLLSFPYCFLPHILISSYPHILISSYPHILISSYPHILISSYPHILHQLSLNANFKIFKTAATAGKLLSNVEFSRPCHHAWLNLPK